MASRRGQLEPLRLWATCRDEAFADASIEGPGGGMAGCRGSPPAVSVLGSEDFKVKGSR